MTATETTTTVVVPGTHLMAALVGPRDQHLRQIEDGLPRAPRSACAATRSPSAASSPSRSAGCSRSWSACSQRGHELDEPQPRPGDRHGRRRRAAERGPHPRRAARRQGPPGPSQDGRPEALHRRHRATTSSRSASARPAPASRGSPWRWRCKALQAKQVQRIILTRPAVEAGERLGFLPGDLMAKIDPYLRPLYDALYDMVEPEGAQRAARAPDGRGRAAGVHARPHAQQQLHHPRRGAEHDARADEDVPHPHRLRLQGRRHRRRHAGRRARRQERPARPRAGAHRHRRAGLRAPRRRRRRAPPIVADIVAAYERDSDARPARMQARRDRSPSLTTSAADAVPVVTVVGADEQADVDVDVDRWAALAARRAARPRARAAS